ncbi:MAG: DMT family transporter [Acidobacteriota bacterium]
MGAAACLLSALAWAVAVTWFRGPIAEHGSLAVNLGKCWIATILLGLTAWWIGDLSAITTASATAVGMVAISGIAGLTLGDTALFAAVHRLGAHRALLFQTLGPVFAALLAFAFLAEQPTVTQLLGTLAVLAGVALALDPGESEPGAKRSMSVAGIAFAVLAAFGQGAGVVLAKGGMEDVPVIGASFVRLGTAAVGLLVTLAIAGQLGRAARGLARPAAMRGLAGPTLLGTFVGFLLMMLGIARAPASVAAVLLSTAPIFSLFVDRIAVGTRITPRGALGTLIAVAGVAGLVL